MSRVARAIARAAWVLGCVVSVTAPAAEWSFAPNLNWSIDTDSNRSLVPQGTASQSTSVAMNLDLTVATETNRLTLSPLLRWQYFDTKAYGDIFERDLSGADLWTAERGSVNVTAKDGDNSTLTTEATETGILSTNLHQRSDEGGLSATYNETERFALVIDASYSDVSYYGVPQGDLLNLLSGYRYMTASVGEKVQLTETSSVTVSTYQNRDLSRLPGNDSTQTGAQADYRRAFSERWEFEASAGGARVQSARSTKSSTTGSLDVSRSYERGTVAFAYSRSLAPYGTGTLVQRQEVSLTGTRSLTEKLELNMAASRVQNSQPLAQTDDGVQAPQVQTYNNLRTGLDWKPAETWRLASEVDWTRTVAVGLGSGPIHDWHGSVSLTWTPQVLSTSF